MTVEELRQNKLELLGKLVAGFGHEIRNPLSAIRLNLDYMNMFSDELEPDIIDAINSSKEALMRIESLTETILNFTRNKETEDEIPLERIVSDAIELSSIKARSKEVTIHNNLDQKSALFLIKPSKLLQILLNLISNAIDACEENGKIEIASVYDDVAETIYLTVEDTGCGIPIDDVEKIFDEFYTTKNGGTGLGLYVCKCLAEELNANLSVESQEGVGSKFILQFSGGK